MSNPFAVVDQFEEALCEYTQAPFCVTTDSCTNAIFLCLEWLKASGQLDPKKDKLTFPLRTYISPPMSAIRAGFDIEFLDFEWLHYGMYRLGKAPVWDAAKLLTSEMFKSFSNLAVRHMLCLSFHHKKTLPIGKGGAILLDDPDAAEWLYKARYEGRSRNTNYKTDEIDMIGYNHYMLPEHAARGLTLLSSLPRYNLPQDEPGGYPDLSKYPVFKKYV